VGCAPGRRRRRSLLRIVHARRRRRRRSLLRIVHARGAIPNEMGPTRCRARRRRRRTSLLRIVHARGAIPNEMGPTREEEEEESNLGYPPDPLEIGREETFVVDKV
jgi:hypothetical protein